MQVGFEKLSLQKSTFQQTAFSCMLSHSIQSIISIGRNPQKQQVD